MKSFIVEQTYNGWKAIVYGQAYSHSPYGDSLPALSRKSKGKEAGEYSDAKIDGKDKLFTPILTKKNTFLVKKRFGETPGN